MYNTVILNLMHLNQIQATLNFKSEDAFRDIYHRKAETGGGSQGELPYWSFINRV